AVNGQAGHVVAAVLDLDEVLRVGPDAVLGPEERDQLDGARGLERDGRVHEVARDRGGGGDEADPRAAPGPGAGGEGLEAGRDPARVRSAEPRRTRRRRSSPRRRPPSLAPGPACRPPHPRALHSTYRSENVPAGDFSPSLFATVPFIAAPSTVPAKNRGEPATSTAKRIPPFSYLTSRSGVFISTLPARDVSVPASAAPSLRNWTLIARAPAPGSSIVPSQRPSIAAAARLWPWAGR